MSMLRSLSVDEAGCAGCAGVLGAWADLMLSLPADTLEAGRSTVAVGLTAGAEGGVGVKPGKGGVGPPMPNGDPGMPLRRVRQGWVDWASVDT